MPANQALELHLCLDSTVPGTRGGVQIGSGTKGTVLEWQQMTGGEARFIARAQVRDGQLPLRGDVIQKDSKGRFIYVVWRDEIGLVSRRAKIYVESIDQAMVDSGKPIAIRLPGKAKDGLPCCATVKPIKDWTPVP